MLERIGLDQYAGVSRPSEDVLSVMGRILETRADPVIAEIGVGVGATSLALSKLLQGRGQLYLFDFEQSVSELERDLREKGFSNLCCFGNTRKTHDSYTWSLLKLAIEHPEGLFDLAYLDGAHSIAHDIGAVALLKTLVRPEGYLLLDDLHWSFAKSPSMNPEKRPEIRGWFTREQLDTPHVQMIADALLEPDADFERLTFGGKISRGRALYRRRGR